MSPARGDARGLALRDAVSVAPPDAPFRLVTRRGTRSRDDRDRPCLPFSTLRVELHVRAPDGVERLRFARVYAVRAGRVTVLDDLGAAPGHPCWAWFTKAAHAQLRGRAGAQAGARGARRGRSSAELTFVHRFECLDEFGERRAGTELAHRFQDDPPRTRAY